MQDHFASGKGSAETDCPEKRRRITQLGRLFGLSRSTLLYYDRIGLLSPTARTGAGYRCYTREDRLRLERICGFRRAGLSIEEIRTILATEGKPSAAILEKRFHEIGEEIRVLKAKQGLLSQMITGIASTKWPSAVDRTLWVEMLRTAGMDEQAMARWHAEFEQRAPEAHLEFLLSLGIPEAEALEIRKWSRSAAKRPEAGPIDPDGPADSSRREPGAGAGCREKQVTKQKKGVVR